MYWTLMMNIIYTGCDYKDSKLWERTINCMLQCSARNELKAVMFKDVEWIKNCGRRQFELSVREYHNVDFTRCSTFLWIAEIVLKDCFRITVASFDLQSWSFSRFKWVSLMATSRSCVGSQCNLYTFLAIAGRKRHFQAISWISISSNCLFLHILMKFLFAKEGWKNTSQGLMERYYKQWYQTKLF